MYVLKHLFQKRLRVQKKNHANVGNNVPVYIAVQTTVSTNGLPIIVQHVMLPYVKATVSPNTISTDLQHNNKYLQLRLH